MKENIEKKQSFFHTNINTNNQLLYNQNDNYYKVFIILKLQGQFFKR